MTMEETIATLVRECTNALRFAKRYAELDRRFDDAFNDAHTTENSRRLDGIEESMLDAQKGFSDSLLRIHGLVSAFDVKVRELAVLDQIEA